MKTSIFKRSLSMLMALLLCLSAFVSIGTPTAHAANTKAEVFVISFPRDGDANYSGHWGHDALTFMNGWTSGKAVYYMKVRTIGSTEGNVCYCIEPGVPLNIGDKLTEWDENFWDNYPAQYNKTISPDDIKLFIGRIMQYGYTGIVTTSWCSQNAADADKLSHAVATQLLIWEVVVGERDADFNKVSPGSYNAICDQIATDHPLYSQIMNHYKNIETSVKTHSKLPSFFARSTNRAQDIELTWNGTKYTTTLTDTNNVLSNYTFTADKSGIHFSVSGNQLTITADTAPDGPVAITASKNNSQRRGIITWSDGKLAPESDGLQDIVTFAAPVTDPIAGYLNIKVSYGGMKIVKTAEDGKVAGITFTVTGNGVNETVQTNSAGEIQIDNLAPGTYTVSEQSFNEYAPQESRQVTVVSGQTATVTFNNTLRRGDLTVAKTSEDGLVEGVTFHLYGTSLSGAPVDEYAVTDRTGRAYFRNVLIGTGYTLEEMDVPVRYVIPDSQSAAIEWNTVTRKTFENRLKKWNATVTKWDGETGSSQGDGSLAGAVYGVYQGGKLIDTYTTDAAGQFTTDYYPCGDNWSIREIAPSKGYLLDNSIHRVGGEPRRYTAEYNSTSLDVTEQIIKGNISLIKHTDNGDTQLETPEVGAEFVVYLKSAGSYEAARKAERDYLVCDENGFAQTKNLPYGVYTVHQVSGWEGRELLADFDVYIAKDGQTYRYLANNSLFESYIKIVKVDAETGKTIPYAGAGFQIVCPDGSKVTQTFTYPTVTTIDTFYTNSEGYLITPETLEYGTGYSLVEVAAPFGYVLDSTPVYFDVTENDSIKDDGLIVVEVTKANVAQKGVVKISKTGEVFSTVTANSGIYQPVYEVQGLPGAVFEITAAEDIYTPDGTLRYSAGQVVNKQLQKIPGKAGEFRLVSTKNSKGRTITVAASVVKLLREHRIHQLEARLKAGPLWKDTGFVFTNDIGEHLSPNTLYHNYKRVVASIGLPDARLHDLRHSYAVAALRAGDDIKTVQGNLGHHAAAFTLDVYAHVTAEMKQASADRMEQFIRAVSSQ